MPLFEVSLACSGHARPRAVPGALPVRLVPDPAPAWRVQVWSAGDARPRTLPAAVGQTQPLRRHPPTG